MSTGSKNLDQGIASSHTLAHGSICHRNSVIELAIGLWMGGIFK